MIRQALVLVTLLALLVPPVASAETVGVTRTRLPNGMTVFQLNRNETEPFSPIAPSFRGHHFVRKMMPLQPLVERLHLALVAEPDPGAMVTVKKEAHILEAFLHQRVWPGG